MTPIRKPRHHFETTPNPSHVTFDDGKDQRRNLPWSHYVEARWDYHEPDTLRIEIGEWMILLAGHNLGPLFAAVEDQVLIRVKAQPELDQDKEREADSYATDIRFKKTPSKPFSGTSPGQIEIDLQAGDR